MTLAKIEIDGIEFFTASDTGVSGMSITGLAVACGVTRQSVSELLDKLEKYPAGKSAPKTLEPLLGKTLKFQGSQGEVSLVEDSVCTCIISYYATEAKNCTEKAKSTLLTFAAIGIRAYIQKLTGWSDQQKPLTLLESLKLNIELEETRLKLEEEKQKLLADNKDKQQWINVAKPKTDFYDSIIDLPDTIDIGEAAKLLKIKLSSNKYMGRNQLFEFLRSKKILDNYNAPYQKYVDMELFKITETKYNKGADIKIHIKTLVTQKGLDYINKLVTSAINYQDQDINVFDFIESH